MRHFRVFLAAMAHHEKDFAPQSGIILHHVNRVIAVARIDKSNLRLGPIGQWNLAKVPLDERIDLQNAQRGGQ